MKWENVKVEQLCRYVTSGGTPLSSNKAYYNPPTIPWLKTKEVNYCRIMSTENYISQEGLDNSSAKLIPVNSVIVAMYGQGDTAGRVATNSIPLTTNQACCNLIIDETKADYRFVYYALYLLYDKLVALKNGGAQPNLNVTIIKNLKISIPNTETQKHIADILSSYDDLIENNQKQIKLLEEAAQRLYKEWFVDLHFPGYENTKIVDGVPKGWNYETVDNIIKLQSGYAFKSSDFINEGKYKIVTIKNVQDSNFDGTNVNRIAGIPQKMPQHCILSNGDILLSLTGNVGRVCIVYGKDYLLNQRVAKFKTDYPSFAYCLFKSEKMLNDMRNLANGAAQQNLSPIRTEKIQILLPPQILLEKFENTAAPILKMIISLNKKNEVLKDARDRLLPKLMNGEIEV